MPASKPATPRFSADAHGETDFAKVDAHVIQPHEYDELPELTDEMMGRADAHRDGVLLRRGRGLPRVGSPKRQIRLRLDVDVIDAMRASGPDWQVHANEALRTRFKG